MELLCRLHRGLFALVAIVAIHLLMKRLNCVSWQRQVPSCDAHTCYGPTPVMQEFIIAKTTLTKLMQAQ